MKKQEKLIRGYMAMYCGNCGNELNDGAKFCGRCGKRVSVPAFFDEEAKTKKKNKTGGKSWKFRIIAAVMAIVIAVSVFAVKASGEDGYRNQWVYNFDYSLMYMTAWYYNSEGDVQTYVSFDMDDDCNFVPVVIRNYEYDKKGNLIADYYETESGDKKRSREYDSDGNMTYFYYYDSSSDLASDGITMEITYGKSGEMLTATCIGENESDTLKTAFTYDGSRIQYITSYSYGGSLEGYYTFEYNDDGELTGFVLCDGSDTDIFTQEMFSTLYEERFA